MWDNIQIMFNVPVLTLGMIIDGLLIGGIFALIAYGLALVWGVMNVKNLAQGDFVILGAYITWWLYEHAPKWLFEHVPGGSWLYPDGPAGHHISPIIGVPVSFAVLWVLGAIVYRLIISRVITHDLFTSLLATFGLAIVMQQVMKLIFGADEQTIGLNLESFGFFDNLLTIQPTRLIAFVAAVCLAVAVITFMKRSRMGQAIRATAQNPRAARVMGIDTEKVYSFTFSLNAAICGAAGGLISMIWEFQPFIGLIYSIRAFVIVTAAGLGNLGAVIAAGLGMGVIEQTGTFIVGTEFQQAIVVGLLVLVLLVKMIVSSRKRQVVE